LRRPSVSPYPSRVHGRQAPSFSRRACARDLFAWPPLSEKARGMERRVAHPIRTLRRGRASGEDARTPRGAPSRRLCGAGRAFDRHHQGAQAVSQLLAGGLSAPALEAVKRPRPRRQRGCQPGSFYWSILRPPTFSARLR
jgi:hypothetical protein